MSHHSWQIEEVRDAISSKEPSPLRRALWTHLGLVAEAVREIDERDDGLEPLPSEEAAIRACLPDGAPLRQLIGEARKVTFELMAEIGRAEK